MLHRKIEREIENWLDDDPRGRREKSKGTTDKALLMNGVRQAGKTYIIRQCLKSSASPWVEFNLIAQSDLVPLIDGARDVDDLIDFTQYEEDKRKLYIRQIYDQIPAVLNRKNKRFKLADLQKNLRFDRVEDSFTWLWKAGVALGVFNVTEPKIPLLLNTKHNLFKAFLSDVGLLTTRYGKICKLKIVTHEGDGSQGAVYENFVAQELHAHGIDLFYYNSKKRGELDFVLEHEGQVLPIEVKSGKDYLRHSALSQIMKEEAYGIPEAVVLTQDNIQVKGKITYLPIYMTMFLGEDPQGFVDLSVEKFSL